MQSCCSDIKEWMSVNHLKLNEDKTEVILIGREKSIQQIGDTQINIAGANIAFATSVKYLGVMLDQSLSLDSHHLLRLHAPTPHLEYTRLPD